MFYSAFFFILERLAASLFFDRRMAAIESSELSVAGLFDALTPNGWTVSSSSPLPTPEKTSQSSKYFSVTLYPAYCTCPGSVDEACVETATYGACPVVLLGATAMRLLLVPAMLYTVPVIKWPEAPLAGAASFKGIFWLLPFLWHG